MAKAIVDQQLFRFFVDQSRCLPIRALPLSPPDAQRRSTNRPNGHGGHHRPGGQRSPGHQSSAGVLVLGNGNGPHIVQTPTILAQPIDASAAAAASISSTTSRTTRIVVSAAARCIVLDQQFFARCNLDRPDVKGPIVVVRNSARAGIFRPC
jgi:hypothetical protein